MPEKGEYQSGLSQEEEEETRSVREILSERDQAHPEILPTTPNTEDLVQFLDSLEIFTPGDLQDLLEMPFWQALDYAYTIAITNGMEFEEFTSELVQAGLLEPEAGVTIAE